MSLNLDKDKWTRVKLGDVAAASKEKVDPRAGDVDRYIAGEHMDTDDLRINRWGDVREVDLGPAFHRRFRPGQVLYGSRRTYLRKVAVAEFDGVCANTTYVVATNDEAVLLQSFLPFVMTSEAFHAFAIGESKGSVNPYVNWSDIACYEFDLPPIEEQERIADLLWAVERHQRALRNIGVPLTRCADPLMRVEASEFVSVDTVVITARSGSTPSRSNKAYYGGSIPWLKSGEVVGDDIKFSEESITEDGLDNSAAWLVPAGSTVVAMYGDGKTRGQVGRLGREMATNQAVIALVPNPKLADSDFLYYWMRSRQEVLRGKGAGAAQKNLSKGLVVSEPFPDLTVVEQQKAVQLVAEIDRSRCVVETEGNGMTTLRSSLLNEIFGGN